MIIALIAAFVFALFDYFGYSISVKKGWVDYNLINPYRIVQTIVQGIINLILFIYFGWFYVIGFTLLWWTWNCDLLFYLIYDTLGIFGPRTAFKTEVLGNLVSWAWWTPLGLLFYKKTDVIKWPALLSQALIGLIITFLIFL